MGAYATGWLEQSVPQNDETMLHKIGNAQSRATLFRHSAVLSLPAVLLHKLLILFFSLNYKGSRSEHLIYTDMPRRPGVFSSCTDRC